MLNKQKIKDIIKYYLGKTSVVQNINYNPMFKQKRVIISYVDTLFKINNFEHIYATNINELALIIQNFSKLDFTIDIISANDILSMKLIKNKDYDVIFGFGSVFYEISKINMSAKKIMYVTEHHPDFSKKAEMERINYFYARHNKKVSIERSGVYYKEEHFTVANNLILLGEDFPFKKYNLPISRINPTGLFNINYMFQRKDYPNSKKNFLWLGSRGAVHKGLDLLIDIFKKRDDINLHVCGLNKKDKKLFDIDNTKNIIDYGRINIQSDLFLEISNKCSFIILPSCSEAMSTSILTGMNHSLIPIVMKDTGFNKIKELSIFLESFKLEYIENEIDKIIQYDDILLDDLHKKIYKYSKENFTLEKYNLNIEDILKYILNEVK